MSDKKDSTLSLEQVQRYLTKIGYYKDGDNKQSLPSPNFDTLCELLSLQIKAIPFGALSFAYCPSEVKGQDYSVDKVSVKFTDVYTKLINQNREGYCFEQNSLLLRVLQYLGYDCMLATAKVIDIPLYKKTGKIEVEGFQHVVIIINLKNKRFLVDAGFGARSPPKPLELGNLQAVDGEAGFEHRVREVKVEEDGHYDSSILPKSYVMEHRSAKKDANPSNDNELEWKPFYYLSLSVCYPKDLEVLNFYVCHNPHSLFVRHVILARYIQNGQITLMDDRLTIYQNGNVLLQEKLENETTRRKAYKEHFLIDLPEHFNEFLPKDYGKVKL